MAGGRQASGIMSLFAGTIAPALLEPPPPTLGLVIVGSPLVPGGSDEEIPQPSGVVAGDRLFVYGANSIPVIDGSWTELATTGSLFNVHTKIAAGDSTDEGFQNSIVVPESVMVMWAFVDQGDPWTLVVTGLERNSFRTTFDHRGVGASGVGPDLIFAAGMRVATNSNGGSVGSLDDANFSSPNGGDILLRTTTKTTPLNRSFFHGISWSSQDPTPTTVSAGFWSGAQSGSSFNTHSRMWRYNF